MKARLGKVCHGRIRSHFGTMAMRLILALICLPLLTPLLAAAAPKASEVAIPRGLGEIQNRVDGTAGKPFVFVIGEEHVSLRVQREVADILRYLSGAYDIKLVCTEGYDKPLAIAREGLSLVAQRSMAHADLMARRISGVEYFARAYPDIPVIGVEDMKAYQAHGKELDSRGGLEQEAEQWENDFKSFISQDLGNLRVKAEDAKRLEGALKKLMEDKDFGLFTKTIHDILGRESSVGKKVTALNGRRDALQRKALDPTTNSPEMQARDHGMINGTLQAIKQKNASTAALVVGKLHLDGIGKLLKSEGISYVAIVPAGVDEGIAKGPDEEGQKIYDEWRKGKATDLEAWLSHFKPIPANDRSEFRDRTSLLGILAMADHLSKAGMSETDVLNVVRRSPLPRGINIIHVFDIEGGKGIEFAANGKRGYAYFGKTPDQVKAPAGRKAIETGECGGGYYAIYDGGSFQTPPASPGGGGGSGAGGGGGSVPPNSSSGGSGGGGGSQSPIPPKSIRMVVGPSSQPDEFRNIYHAGIVEQKKHQPERVTIAYAVENGSLVRWVDDGPKVVLDVSPSQLSDLRDCYQNARFGPDKLGAAQKLADAILIGLNDQFPEGRKELVQLSEDNLLADISLPMLHELGGQNDSSNLKSIDKTRVYEIQWSKAQEEIPALGRSVNDERREKKAKAKEVIDKETKGTTLNEEASKIMDAAKETKWAEPIKELAGTTPFHGV